MYEMKVMEHVALWTNPQVQLIADQTVIVSLLKSEAKFLINHGGVTTTYNIYSSLVITKHLYSRFYVLSAAFIAPVSLSWPDWPVSFWTHRSLIYVTQGGWNERKYNTEGDLT